MSHDTITPTDARGTRASQLLSKYDSLLPRRGRKTAGDPAPSRQIPTSIGTPQIPPPRYYPTVEPIRAAQIIIHGRRMGAQFGIGACPPVSVLHLRSRHIHHRPLRKVLPLVARLFCPDSGQDCRISSTMATGAPIRNWGIPPQNVTIAVTIRCVSVRFYAP